MPLLKARMDRAQAQLQELESKRAEEREEHINLQAEREQYESELARLTRQYAAEIHDLEQRMRTTVEKHEQYDREVKEVLDLHREETSAAALGRSPEHREGRGAKKPDGLGQRRLLASPSPARGGNSSRRLPSASPYRSV